MLTRPTETAVAGLVMLIILQAIMLMSLFAGLAPHPPAKIPLGGIAPILAVSFAVASAAIILGPVSSGAGRAFALLAVVIALLSFGPQKFVDGQFALIWPAVILGQISAIMVLIGIFVKPVQKPVR
ncbi:hypothetical protein [Aliiroseovarius sp. F47248L]|uniref:hypothetical protein n=1 Tax=Aliiroseovarius sp. F47248L TaxID=2926420 RepID=UPI001FF468E0|nr:hypothetical protein [Aliiroseovarius sp. F47248L]MCK0140300.1 hypothetical protein [Aliiroseovarius sp. F47248L]